ncbi:MAG: AAA family ATPase [Victivallales bacterium]|nr:AAA family ATPase [Victivallales bacterium]
MFEYYIKKIHIGQVRHLKDVDIPICEDECRHLILTGRNGSGKTSLLEAMRDYFDNFIILQNGIFPSTNDNFDDYINRIEIVESKKELIIQPSFNVDFRGMLEALFKSKFIIAYFEDERKFSANLAKKIEKVELKDSYSLEDKPSELFIKYLLDLKMTEALSKNNGHKDKALQINEWFGKLEKLLQRLFEDKELKLLFDEDTFEFKIQEPDGKLFDFNTMSAGYAAAFDIIVDLMMRMEKNSNRSFRYDLPGIVLIDEIETHLHLELQKLILPMLTELFPNIQFIVSTHSPFVINSIENATIFDLEKKTLVSNGLGNIPYEGVIDGYFEIDRLSETLRNKFEEYKKLCQKKKKTDLDYAKAAELEAYLDEVPDYLAIDFASEYSRRKLEFHKQRGGE